MRSARNLDWLRAWPPHDIDSAQCADLLEAYPRDPRLHTLRGIMYHDSGSDAEAVAAWQTAIQLWGRRATDAVAELRHQLGSALLRLGRVREGRRNLSLAARGFRRVRSWDRVPAYTADIAVREAECLVALGRTAAAASLLNEVASGDFAEALEPRINAVRRELDGRP